MSATYPDLPPETWIRVESAEGDHLQLSWSKRSSRQLVLVRLGIAAAFGYLTYFLGAGVVSVWEDLLGEQPAGWGAFPWAIRLVLLVLMTLVVLIPAWFAYAHVYSVLHVRKPDRLTLGPAGLRYEREGPWGLQWLVTEVPGAEVSAVRLKRVDREPDLRRLYIDCDSGPVGVGISLRQADRDWLAVVLRRWAVEQAPPPAAALAPPRKSTITTERGPGGEVTLRWRPSTPEMERERRAILINLTIFLPLFLAILGTLIWTFVGMLLAPWDGPPGGEGLLFRGSSLVLVLGGALGLSRAVAPLLRVYWYLVRGPRWACLTLTPAALRYEPGRYLQKTNRGNLPRVCAEPRRTIARSELGDVRLEPVGERQRLTVEHGAERVEIGAELRDPEREWLAGALRAWAGSSQAPDRQPAALADGPPGAP